MSLGKAALRFGLVLWVIVFISGAFLGAAEISGILPTIQDGSLATANEPSQVASVLQVVALLTILTLAPSILIMTTCFTRIVVVMGFLRRALATQQLPPNAVVMGLSLFLTLFIMYPTWEKSWQEGLGPYMRGDLVEGQPVGQYETFERTMAPIRTFMFRSLEDNRGREEVDLFMKLAGEETDDETVLTRKMVPSYVLIPAYITSELKRAFWMGFLLYLPFLVIDMVISSVLMSMGMMMLPPAMISLPFKIIMFVLVDGWNLLVEGLVLSFPLGAG